MCSTFLMNFVRATYSSARYSNTFQPVKNSHSRLEHYLGKFRRKRCLIGKEKMYIELPSNLVLVVHRALYCYINNLIHNCSRDFQHHG